MVQATQPNIVFILADNVGWGDFGVYGGLTPTPRVDALAATGIRFTIEAAADTVAIALAIEDAAAEDVADTLFAANLIKEAAVEDAERVVSEALEAEEAAQPV
jgi:hypothetical protein